MTDFANTSVQELFTAFFGPSAFGIPLRPYAAMRNAAEPRRCQEKGIETSPAGAEAPQHSGSASG